MCYLTRRIDRAKKGEKIAVKDMCQLTERQVEKLIAKYVKLLPKFHDYISASFLSEELKDKYYALLDERMGRMSV